MVRFAWVAVAILGACAFGVLALARGEPVSAAWLLTAALCTYLISYRFYSGFIARRVFALDANRLTPAERLADGRDYVPTNRYIVFGHHFAAIAGPGPLVGPTLAAQFGFLPGAIWILAGVALGGAVQDFVILCASVRRDGKSLGQMAKEEIGPVAGYTALVAVLGIMVILVAVLGLVVVNALKTSPWGTVTIGLTIPIALLLGVYLRYLRPNRVLEASAIGAVLLALALLLLLLAAIALATIAPPASAYFTGQAGNATGGSSIGTLSPPVLSTPTPGAGTVTLSWSAVTPPASGTVTYYVTRAGGTVGGNC